MNNVTNTDNINLELTTGSSPGCQSDYVNLKTELGLKNLIIDKYINQIPDEE